MNVKEDWVVLGALFAVCGCMVAEPEQGESSEAPGVEEASAEGLAPELVPEEGMAPFVIPAPGEEFPASDLWPAEVEKTCGTFGAGGIRNDWAGTYGLLWGGNWGTYGCLDICPAGSYAGSVRVRQEASQGSGDDTGLNTIHMSCFSKATGLYTGFITSRTGSWGTWSAELFCPSEPIIGGLLKWQASQGSGDDFAATGIRTYCQGTTPQLEPPSPPNTGWGSWQSLSGLCGGSTAVCAIQTVVEANQGSGDDTSLNGTVLACCNY